MIQVHTHQITKFLLLRLYVKLNIFTSNLLGFPHNLITINDNFFRYYDNIESLARYRLP